MIPDPPLSHPGPPPPQTDVVVIGGGIIGIMTAWFLAERGLRAVVCEKGRVGAEQSSRNWGWIRQTGRDPAELPIVIEALSHWERLAQGFGDALGFRRTGVAYLADTDRDMENFAGWLPHAQSLGVDSRLLSGREVRALMPGARGWHGALHTPSDARAEPWVAVPLIAAEAARRGVTIVEDCAVRALDLAAGRVAGVVTEQGRMACAQVVVAGGAWSRLFLQAHGVAIPQLSVRATVAATAPLPQVFAGSAADNRIAFRRRMDGGYTLAPGTGHDIYAGPDALRSFGAFWKPAVTGLRHSPLHLTSPRGFPDAWTTPRSWSPDGPSPFEAMRVLNPAPSPRFAGRLAQDFRAAFPGLPEVQLTRSWAGMIDTMPDVVPVVDHAPIPGLTIATGMSGHGFGIGPGFGRIIADLVAGNAPGHDLHRFRLSRFTDGSKLVPGPSL